MTAAGKQPPGPLREDPAEGWEIAVPARLIEAAGQALYGEDWTTGLALALGVDQQTAEEWAGAARDGVDYLLAPSLLTAMAATLDTRHRAYAEAADAMAKAARALKKRL